VSLATRPASPVRVTGLGRSDLLDGRGWSLLGQDVGKLGRAGGVLVQVVSPRTRQSTALANLARTQRGPAVVPIREGAGQ